jgi:hypothetical protein
MSNNQKPADITTGFVQDSAEILKGKVQKSPSPLPDANQQKTVTTTKSTAKPKAK